MRKLPKSLAAMALSLAATAALPAMSFGQDRDADSTEMITRADDLPADVRRTIEREAIGANHFIDRRDRDDKIRYVVHFTAPDGKRLRMRVDERGEIVEEPNLARVQPDANLEEEHAKDDADRSVRYTTIKEDEVPDRVHKAMDKFREGTHDPVFQRQVRGGKTFYSVHYTTAASERMWVRLAENGDVAEGPHINIGKDIGLRIAGAKEGDTPRPVTNKREALTADQLPADIRRVVERETEGGVEHQFVRETRGDRVTYLVEYKKDGKVGSLRLNEGGRVLDETEVADAARPAAEMKRDELTANQLPAEVRRTIERETAGASEHKFVREAQGDQVSYFVEYTKDGQRGNLRVDERGKVLGETEVAGTPKPAPTPAPAPASQDDAELAAATVGASHVTIGVGDLPAEVRAAFEKAAPGTEHIVQKHTQDGRTLYTVHYRTAEDNHNFAVADDKGQIVVEPRASRWLEAAKGVRFEVLGADQLPAEVRATVEKQAAQATEHLFVRRVRPEGEPTYLVQFTNAKGRRMQMEVNANGKLRDEVAAAQEEPFRIVGKKDRD